MSRNKQSAGIAVAAAALAGTILCGGAQAAPILYDGFAVPQEYKSGKTVSDVSGGIGFAEAWKVDTSKNVNNINRYKAGGGGSEYIDGKGAKLSSAPGMLRVRSAGTGEGALTRKFEKDLTGTVWFSFLSKMDNQPGYGWDVQLLDAKGVKQIAVFNGNAKNKRWRIVDASGKKKAYLPSKEGVRPTDLCLVIGKLEGVGAEGNAGSFTLYINPTDLKSVEGSAAVKSSIKGISIAALRTFKFSKKSASKGMLDELRIGDSLSGVIPLK